MLRQLGYVRRDASGFVAELVVQVRSRYREFLDGPLDFDERSSTCWYALVV